MDCVKNIGCFPSCNVIRFPYPALETGVHLLIFDWLGTKKTIAFEAVQGEHFYIPNNFNESSDPVFSIKLPSGSYLCWDSALEELAVCPSTLGNDCDFYKHFTFDINQTAGMQEEPVYSDKIYNIDSAFDRGDGSFTINVVSPSDGDLAVDDNGTFYEYNDGIWTVKFKEVCAFQDVDTLPDTGEDCALYFQGGRYWQWDGAQFVDVTPTIDFDDINGLPNLVRSVNGGIGIDVDNTDPQNPIVGLDQDSQDSLDLADSAIQPGDNVSDLTNDAGYLNEVAHDNLPQDNPHGVTKAQVGLGNVDNTSDADKPVSTAQGQAINQAEADAKQYTDDEINALNLGSASQADVGDFATAAQGAKADTAIQTGDNVFELNTQFQTLADAPTISWDVSQGEIAKVVLGGNRTLANPINLKAGRYDLIVEQDGTGNRVLYLDSNYRMPDGELVLSSDAGSQDKVSFVSDGSLMYGAINKGYRYVPQGFVMTVDTSKTGTSTNTQFTIPTTGSGYNYSVKNANTGVAYLTGQTGDATVDFGATGVYDIEISGDFPRIYFSNGGDKNKLIEIKQWGNIAWVSFLRAFWGCSNLIQVTSADVPNLSGASIIASIFQNCTSLIHVNRIEDWDVSGMINFDFTFSFTQFNQDISGWDVSSAERMDRMLQGTPFDQDISNWDIGNLTIADFFMSGVTLSTVNYDAILNGWAAQTVQPNLSINFGNSKYSAAGQAGRDDLINNHGWVITDGGLAP